MPETPKDPAYHKFLDSAQNPRQKESLERIKAAADYLSANGIKISPSKIEQYCVNRAWNGPKAQSIRNSKENLFAYLKIRMANQHFRARPNHVSSPDIRDESIRLYVDLVTQERDEARAECTRIRQGLRSLPGLSVDALLSDESATLPAVQLPGNMDVLRPSLLAAVAKLFDANTLASCGLELYKERIRQQATKNVLLERQESEALRSLAQLLSTS